MLNSMVNTVFYFLLNMSITASLVGVLLMLLRLNRKISGIGTYALWGLVFIRLVFPFALSSEISLFNFANGLIKKVVSLPDVVPVTRIELTTANYVGAAKEYYPVAYKNGFFEKLFGFAAFTWIVVAVAAILTVAIIYNLTRSELRKAQHFKDNIYVSDTVDTPMVFGVFRPKIIIPPKLNKQSKELEYVLLHEQIHIRRHDNLFRLLGIITACIHWFNPLVWVFLKLFLKDMELTCDLKAVKHFSKDERKDYARVLVNLSFKDKVFVSTAFGKTNVRVRVLNVINYKKMTVLAIIVSIFFVAAVTAALVTNPIR